MKKITIAIDGYSSTGKSTIAKRLASALGYVFVDTGAMYRAVTFFAIENNLVSKRKVDVKELIKHLSSIVLLFKHNENLGKCEMYLNGDNVEKEIRKMEVSENVSQVAVIKEVREKLVSLQKEMGREKGVVMDGRDIGTVVFPNAELKLFMTASPETRATRRYKELLDRGEEVTFEEVLKNVRERDYMDSHRKISPLKKAADAIEFDNSDMGLEEQFERIHSHVQDVINSK